MNPLPWDMVRSFSRQTAVDCEEAMVTESSAFESTFRAIGIGYPDPYDTTRDAKRKSALRAAREIALAAIELALTKNMNTDNALRMRTFIQTNAAVVKHMDHEDGHIEIMLEIYQTGLRSIVISGNAGALP